MENSYRAINKECLRHNDKEAILKYGHKLPKGIRAKYVNAHIEWTLRHLTKNVDEAHKRYIDRIEQDVIIKRETNRRRNSMMLKKTSNHSETSMLNTRLFRCLILWSINSTTRVNLNFTKLR